MTSKSSRIYHSAAAAQRIETAIREELGATIAADAELCIKARIDDDLCAISIDTSGESLHKRGHKQAIGKAPMRETLASLFLRQCGYDGTEAVVDPMCGSGTFVIEAAEIAAGLKPGRSRRFAFEQLAGFDQAAWIGHSQSAPWHKDRRQEDPLWSVWRARKNPPDPLRPLARGAGDDRDFARQDHRPALRGPVSPCGPWRSESAVVPDGTFAVRGLLVTVLGSVPERQGPLCSRITRSEKKGRCS